MKSFFWAVAAAAMFMMTTTSSDAGFFNTGFSSTGVAVAPNSLDGNYSIGANQTFVSSNPAWLDNDAVSSWISPVGGVGASVAGTSFVYEMSFVAFAGSTTFAGRWLTDNNGINITLNGVALASGTTRPLEAFSLPSDWTFFTSGALNSIFTDGLTQNIVQFTVGNQANTPSALRVELMGDIVPVPLPAAAALFLTGLPCLSGLGLVLRRKKK